MVDRAARGPYLIAVPRSVGTPRCGIRHSKEQAAQISHPIPHSIALHKEAQTYSARLRPRRASAKA